MRSSIPYGCSKSELETAIFGRPVWRIDKIDGFSHLKLIELVARARRHNVALISCRISDRAVDEADLLLHAGFRRIERLLTFERQVPSVMSPCKVVSLANSDQYGAIVELAGKAFVYDRFNSDKVIAPGIAKEIKKKWMRNNLAGRANAVLVSTNNGCLEGFIACLLREGVCIIDLIAVSPECKRTGVGMKLISGVLCHYAGSALSIRVGTQDRNEAAIKLYRKCDFQQVTAQVTFHLTLEK